MKNKEEFYKSWWMNNIDEYYNEKSLINYIIENENKWKEELYNNELEESYNEN